MPWLFLIIALFMVGEYLAYSAIRAVLQIFFDQQMISWIVLSEFAISSWYGYSLMKKQKQQSLELLQPSPESATLAQRLSIMFAGLLLFFPGFLTDLLGLFILKSRSGQTLMSGIERFSPVQGPLSVSYTTISIHRKTPYPPPDNPQSCAHQSAKNHTARNRAKPTNQIIDVDTAESRF